MVVGTVRALMTNAQEYVELPIYTLEHLLEARRSREITSNEFADGVRILRNDEIDQLSALLMARSRRSRYATA